MKRKYTISIDPVHFHYKFSNRIEEIGNPVNYYKMKDEPELVPFTILCDCDKAEITGFVRRASAGIHYLPFLANGFIKRGGKNSGLSIKVKESDELREFCNRMKDILSGEGMNFEDHLNGKNGLLIPVMNYPGLLDAEIISRHAESNTSGVLMKILTTFRRKPAYKIRSFVLPAESFRIRITDDEGNIIIFDLVTGKKVESDDEKGLHESYEKFRTLKGYQSETQSHKEDECIFFTSDMHFDHHPIILGGARPFMKGDSDEMNEVLIINWNNTVKPADRIYFLGDLTYNLDGGTAAGYLSRLNGKITFIAGNHDRDIDGSLESMMFEDEGREFYLVHDPVKIPENFQGWTIHGHTHNSRMDDYPFVNFEKRTINVSCELTSYHPIEIHDIRRIIDLYEEGIMENKIMLYEDIAEFIRDN